MAELQEWQLHPEVGTPEAATSRAANTGEPAWMAHPEAPAAPEPPKAVPVLRPDASPPTVLELLLFGRDAEALNPEWSKNVAREAAGGGTFGLSDKAMAAADATIDKLHGSPEGWSDAYHKTLDHLREQSHRFAETNPAASWGA